VAAVLVLGAASFVTWRQIGYWQNSYYVWLHTVDVTENNPVAESDLAGALRTLGRFEEALPHYQNAARMQPRDPKRHADLAEDLAECDRLPESIAEYETTIHLTSDSVERARSYQSLAILYGEMGEYAEAGESYRKTLQADPQVGQEILRTLSEQVAQAHTSQGYLVLGIFLQVAGRNADARAAYEEALTLEPTLEAAKQSLNALEENHK
jgi:tetratricopeptide (TPR) repeat protein